MRAPRRSGPPTAPPAHRRGPLAPLAGLLAALLAVAGLLLTGPGTAQAADVDVIKNGDFAIGNHLTYWTCSQVVPAPNGGVQGTPAGSDYAQCSQVVPVKPSSTYVLTATVQGPYVFLGATGTGGNDQSTWSGNTSWNTLGTTFTTGPATTSVTVWFHGWYGQGTYQVNKVSMVGPGDPAPSSSMTTPIPSTSASPSPSSSASSSSSASPSPRGSTTTPPGPGLPKHKLTGYWQNFDNEYFKLALNTKDILTVVNMQYYNSDAMNGCDGNVYSQGTENFLTALACIQLKGGLDPSQVGLGVPASTSAAGGGYVSPATVDAALDCLAAGTNCGSYQPDTKWPGIGGAMTWSTNWNAKAGGAIATTIGAHLHAMG